MRKIIFAIVALIPLALCGQNNRTFDGSENNLRHAEWGATHTPLPRLAPPKYFDGMGSIYDADLPNPREISNLAMDQPLMYFDTITHASDFVWAYGQFIDHDIILTENGSDIYCTSIPNGDPEFDPFATGQQQMCIRRSEIEEGSGTSQTHPREHVNNISAWVDGSGVYGSDKERADWLRSFQDGKLKVNENGLLPWNTMDGNADSSVDPMAPGMADDTGMNDKLMVAGDVRANENILLSALHSVFVKEHNRLCDNLKTANPDWTDEELYQYARKLVSGYIQNITFNEWLPAVGVELPPYRGYNPNLNPSISNEFSSSAFRIGHTLINSLVNRRDRNGDVYPGGHLLLREAFFNPRQFNQDGECPYFLGAVTQYMQMFDRMLIDDLRNFLFGVPGSGGMDLSTINIMRGRERGIPSMNEVRQSIGLNPYSDFSDLNADTDTYGKLGDIYESVDDIDLWVGVLAEGVDDNEIFGETTIEILEDQFVALRDGDRFYFQIDPVLKLSEKLDILETSLADILVRNTCMTEEDVTSSTVFRLDEVSSNVDEVFGSTEISIFPNPVYDNFRMSFESKLSGKASLIITDQLGRIISKEQKTVKAGANTIAGLINSDMPVGVYYLKIALKEGSINGKLVKVKY